MDVVELRLFRAIARNIQHLRESQKLSQDEFAEKCGLSRNQVIRAESGRGETRMQTLLKIAMAMGCRLESLMREKKEKEVEFHPLEAIRKAAKGSPAGVDGSFRFVGFSKWRGRIYTLKNRSAISISLQGGSSYLVHGRRESCWALSGANRLIVRKEDFLVVRGEGQLRLVNPFSSPCEVWVMKGP